jgi:hypothetical protein
VKLRAPHITLGLPATISRKSPISFVSAECSMAGRVPPGQRGGGGMPRQTPQPRDGWGDFSARGGG